MTGGNLSLSLSISTSILISNIYLPVSNSLIGAGANNSSGSRLGLLLSYQPSWLRPTENNCLAIPKEMAATLDPRLQELLGYNISPP